MRLEGKRALVTGAGRGIGKAVALALASEGADVVVNYVTDPDEADQVCKQIQASGRNSIPLYSDVAKRGEVEGMFDRASTELGALDLLVNNAGVETIVPLTELTDDQWQHVTDVNLKGTWMCSQVFARRAIAEQRSGAIVNIGSVQAGLALPGRTHYAPTKRGVEALTCNMAAELAEHDIRVNCVHPGVIDTAMTQWVLANPDVLPTVMAKIPQGRPGQPGEVAPAVLFLASEEAGYITGQHIYVDGGMRVV